MISDNKKAVELITNWVLQRAIRTASQSLVVGVSGGVDSALVAALCKKTGVPTIGVIMPCHSSADSTLRGREVVEALSLHHFIVDLTDAFQTIQDPVGVADLEDVNLRNLADGSLRSCLRAPTLDYVAKLHGGLIVGTGNLSEDGWYDPVLGRGTGPRYFQKRGDGCVDISPISGLFKSEVYQLSRFLDVPRSVLEARPSADLWGQDGNHFDEDQLGMTYDEIEAGMREVIDWPAGKQFDASSLSENGSQLFLMEENSRHKWNPNLPALSREDLKEAGVLDVADPVS